MQLEGSYTLETDHLKRSWGAQGVRKVLGTSIDFEENRSFFLTEYDSLVLPVFFLNYIGKTKLPFRRRFASVSFKKCSLTGSH